VTPAAIYQKKLEPSRGAELRLTLGVADHAIRPGSFVPAPVPGKRGHFRVLFFSAHHIATQERAVIRFIEGAGRELQNRLCGIFLARDKAIAVEF
jgi:hypothetical protein